MANLYAHEILEQGPEQTRFDFSLFSLLTSSKEEFMVDGMRILHEGSTAWKNYLADFGKKLEKSGMKPKEVEEIVKRHASSNKYIITDMKNDEDVPFYAMHYTFYNDPLYGNIEKRLLYNRDGGVMGDIAVSRKQIDFFRLAGRPVDEAKKARSVKGYYYDGTLRDALKEFEHEGFTFNLLNTNWYAHYLVNGERTKDISHVTPVERVSIEKLVGMRSRI